MLDNFEPDIDEQGRLVWTSLADAPDDAELVLLGLDGGDRPLFAAYIPGMRAPAGRSLRLFGLLDQFAPGEAATYAAARIGARLAQPPPLLRQLRYARPRCSAPGGAGPAPIAMPSIFPASIRSSS